MRPSNPNIANVGPLHDTDCFMIDRPSSDKALKTTIGDMKLAFGGEKVVYVKAQDTGYGSPIMESECVDFATMQSVLLALGANHWGSNANEPWCNYYYDGYTLISFLKSQYGIEPYVIGDQGETRVICRQGTGGENVFMILPTIGGHYDRSDRLQFTAKDTVYSIDSSDTQLWLGVGENGSLRGSSRNNVPIAYSAGGYKFTDKLHIDFEFYPDTDDAPYLSAGWSPTGGTGVFLRGDDSSDSQPASRPVLNSVGALATYTLSENEYNFLGSPITGIFPITSDIYTSPWEQLGKLCTNSGGYTATVNGYPRDGERYLFSKTGGTNFDIIGIDPLYGTGKQIKLPDGTLVDSITVSALHTVVELVFVKTENCWYLFEQDQLAWMQGLLAWAKIDKTGASGADVGLSMVLNRQQQIYHGWKDVNADALSATPFNNATREFTLFLSGAESFINGVQNVFAGNGLTVQIGTTLGQHFIWMEDDWGLHTSTTVFDIMDINKIPVATVHWDGVEGLVADELHDWRRDLLEHKKQHDTDGARYVSGFTPTPTFGPGATNTFSILGGVIRDEDRYHTIPTSTTLRIGYRVSGGASMTWDALSTEYAKLVTGGLVYDNNGTLTPVTNTNYGIMWVYATNRPAYVGQLTAIVGQGQYTNVANAQAASQPLLPGLAVAEWKLLYRVICRRTAGTPFSFTQSDTMYNLTSGPAVTAGAFSTLPANNVVYTPTAPDTSATVQVKLDSLTNQITMAPVDGSATKSLSTAEVTLTTLENFGQTANADLTLPTAAQGMSFMMLVNETNAYTWRIRAGANDKIYLNGVAGLDNGYVGISSPPVGSYISVFTFKTAAGIYDWMAMVGLGNWVIS